MSRYLNRQEIADKASYEGGFYDFLFGYGFTLADVPKDDPDLLAVAEELFAALPAFKAAVEDFLALLPEPGDEDY